MVRKADERESATQSRGPFRDLQGIDFGGHHKVAFRQPINLVCPDGDPGLAPRKIDVGVVALLFGELPDSVGELESVPKIRELKSSFDVVLIDDLPPGALDRPGVGARFPGEGARLPGRARMFFGPTPSCFPSYVLT